MIREHWDLDPEVVFLNHGAFGAAPRRVLAAQAELRALLERQPVRFFREEYQPRLDAARAALAAFVGAAPEDLVLVGNATTAVNAVLRSLRLSPGDELLTTDHAYAACRHALEWVAERAGARVVVARVPFPLSDPAEIAGPLLAAVSPRTRLALVDHVTSPTALIFPLDEIVPALEQRGVAVLVDGAHAPGMLPLAVARLGASYYTGNCHKWLGAPKGVGFLWVRPDRQDGVVPVVLSHGLHAPPGDARPRLHQLFDWTGTDDPTARLVLGECLDFWAGLLPGGWPEIYATNHARAVRAQARLAGALGIAPPCPPALLGAMAALPLPDADPDLLGPRLWQEHRIELPVFPWPSPPRRLLRVALPSYATDDEIDRLAALLA